MSSLADCFKKAGKALSSQDRSAIEALVADGLSEEDAVQQHLTSLNGELQSVADTVEADGGTVARDAVEQPEVLRQAINPQRNQIGMYQGVEEVVLTMNIPAWTPNKKAKKVVQAKMDKLHEQRKELVERRRVVDKAYIQGLDALQAKPNTTPAEVNAYMDTDVDGGKLDNEIRALDAQVAQLASERDGDPAANGTDIWAKINASAKKKELEWIALEEFLTLARSSKQELPLKFTRENVLDFIHANGLEVEEMNTDTSAAEVEGSGTFNWSESVDEDSANWDGRADDYMYDFDRNDTIEDMADDLYFITGDELQTLINEKIEELKESPIADLPEAVVEAQEKLKQLDDISPDQMTLEGIEERDVTQERIAALAEIEKAMLPEIRDAVYERAEKAAEEEYMDNPVRMYYDSDTGVEITGNDDYGYRVSHQNGGLIDDIWSFNEAEVAARDMAYENGLFDGDYDGDGENVAKWGDESYNTPGDYDNYRELKLKLPKIEGDFYQTAHFPDRNIVAFLRVDDRTMWGESKNEIAGRLFAPDTTGITVKEAEGFTRTADGEVMVYDLFRSNGVKLDRITAASSDQALSKWAESSKQDEFFRNKLPTYFIEEFQSDWHTAGRRFGYVTAEELPNLLELKLENSRLVNELNITFEPSSELDGLSHPNGDGTFNVRRYATFKEGVLRNPLSGENAKKYVKDVDTFLKGTEEGMKVFNSINDSIRFEHNVPDAPFSGDDWLRFGLKRAIVDAVENGYKAFAWPNAASISARWSDSYDYSSQYDNKMTAIVKKLVHIPPAQLDMNGEAILTRQEYINAHQVVENGNVFDIHANGEKVIGDFDSFNQADTWVTDTADEASKAQGYHIVPITEELMARVKAESFPLFQGLDSTEARGYYDPAASLIRLTETANLSTFMHEFAHFMYEMERKTGGKTLDQINKWYLRIAPTIAKESGTTEGEVRQYVKYDTTGDAKVDAKIRTAVHENFARAWEQYLMEGKSPSVELKKAFRAIARWITEVYLLVTGGLEHQLDDEMRQVFASLIATEEQIKFAEATAQIEPMFTDAVAAGMTEEQYQSYLERQRESSDTAAETLRDQLIKQFTRETSQWWRHEKSVVEDDEREKLKTDIVYIARDLLLGDTLKLDRTATHELVGKTVTDKRGVKSKRLPANLNKMTITGGEGVHPDQAAAFLGYESGGEMLDDLINAPSLNDAVKERAEKIMKDRHGDILNDGTIQQLADDALHNEERAKLLMTELKTLAKGTRQPVISRQAIQDIAERTIGERTYSQLHPGKYRKAELRAAQEAAIAHEQGNKEEAARAKARQLMNFYLGKSAQEARDATLKIVEHTARYRSKATREKISKADGGFIGQIDKILKRFELRKSATLKAVDKANESLQKWANDRIADHGDALVLIPEVLDETYVSHWKNVPFKTLKGISDALKNIEHVARYSNQITEAQEKVDFNKLVNRWVAHIKGNGKAKFKSTEMTVVETRNWGRWTMAQMTKIPWMASWLDGGERAGMSHDILVQRFTEAYNKEISLWREVGNVVMKAIHDRSKADRKRHNSKLYIKELDITLMGHQVLAVALNTGNAGNLRKMLLGEGWATAENEADIVFENPKLQTVLQHMTKKDWTLVQLIWDQMNELYPQLAEVHRRTTGLVPPKVEATPIQTSHGTFNGGYYPVKYDPSRSHQAAKNEERMNAQVESMFGSTGSIQASVAASATNERTGYYGPIRLSLDVVPTHFQETIHYITHHDAVREVNKLIQDERVATAIKESIGPEEFAQLKPWLHSIAKDGRETATKLSWDTVLGRLRFGLTLGIMGFKASTGIIQVLGLSNTAAEVGVKNLYHAVRNILGSPDDIKEAWEFAVANSEVMNHRAQTMDREIKNAMHRLTGKTGLIAGVQEMSMKHIALVQTYMVDLPSWYAAYIKGMNEWGDEARSFKYADWVIENVQGSGAVKDLTAQTRSQNEFFKQLTMFMTFFSSMWNSQRDVVKGAASKRYSPTTIAAKLMFILVIPVYLEMLMRDDFDDDDDDETALQKYLMQLAVYPTQSIPVIRDIAQGVSTDYGYNFSPLDQLLSNGIRTIPEFVTRGFTDEDITKGQWKGTTKVVGAATGFPGVNQAWATGEHLYEVFEEGEELTMHQLLFGPKR